MAGRIAEILLSMGAIKPNQVEAVLLEQQGGDRRLFGAIALSLGFIKHNALRRYADYLDEHEDSAV